jgi:hypothetical protein
MELRDMRTVFRPPSYSIFRSRMMTRKRVRTPGGEEEAHPRCGYPDVLRQYVEEHPLRGHPDEANDESALMWKWNYQETMTGATFTGET